MGLQKAIKTPEELWILFEDYERDLKAKPMHKYEFNAKVGDLVAIPLERPLTWSRFDDFVYAKGIIQELEDYRQNTGGRYADFKGVVTRINRRMYADKFEGASCGIFNANIIARDLGLTDKKEDTVIIEPAKIKWGKDQVEI